jgi:opacity protein-like surface antigen
MGKIMTLKSLLLGTAAAFAVVSGAQAADAIVAAAPEPMDYVKVCDAFGTGYFYIPGTETCLKISGHVRMDIASSTGATGFTVSSRGQVGFDTANDSEYGKVYSSFFVRGSRDNAGTLSYNSEYKAGIGGFEFGYNGGKYDGISGGFTDNGGSWGGHAGHYVAYNFSAGNFGGFISLDHDNSLNYTPDLAAGVNFTAGDAYGALGIGYDESLSSVALKGNVGTKFGAVGVRLMGAYANNAGNQYWGHDGWSLGVGVSADVASNVSIAADYQYLSDTASSLIVGDVAWAVAPGFKVLGEVSYTTANDVTSGFVRFERSF